MKIDDMTRRSTDSAYMLPYWDKVDALIDGVEAMRLAGSMYLPPFTDESADDYAFRLTMTKMTNVYSDIIEGLASKPFEEPISLIDTSGEGDDIEPPEAIRSFINDVDGSGNNITVFAAQTFYNGINAAIDWIFVDYSERDPTIRTRADAIRAGLRPYWSHVLGRNVLEVRSTVINGKETLTYFRVLEPGEPDHVRVFERDAAGEVTWALHKKTDKGFAKVGEGVVSIGVIPMVPFATGRRDGRSWKFFPAMKAAADLQIEIYQQESGLKFAKTLTAYPMLAANGIAAPKDAAGQPKKLAVGPNRVLYSAPDASGNRPGSWGYVEPSSESLKFLSEDIDKAIQQLRELGRQPLTAQSGNITVITAAVAAGKAKSAVKAWAYRLKDTLENALLMTSLWLGDTAYDPAVHVFTEFDDYMDGDDLTSLDADRDRGDISRETLWEEKKRRSVYSSNFTPERERKRLLDELPAGIGSAEETETAGGRMTNGAIGRMTGKVTQ